MTNIYITRHGKKRIRKRNGINSKSVNRIAEKAYIYGLKHSEATGNLKKWITKLYLTYKTANAIRIYGDKAYIFSGNKLITVFQVPNELLHIAYANMKKKK